MYKLLHVFMTCLETCNVFGVVLLSHKLSTLQPLFSCLHFPFQFNTCCQCTFRLLACCCCTQAVLVCRLGCFIFIILMLNTADAQLVCVAADGLNSHLLCCAPKPTASPQIEVHNQPMDLNSIINGAGLPLANLKLDWIQLVSNGLNRIRVIP